MIEKRDKETCANQDWKTLDLRWEYIKNSKYEDEFQKLDEIGAGIIYKTLWFSTKRIDVEFTNKACESYKKYKIFNEEIEINKKGLIVNKDKDNEYSLTADLMNGWWGAFKHLFDIKENRDKFCLTVIDPKNNYPMGDKELFDRLLKGKTCDKKALNHLIDSLIAYLKVVYTIGNITPAVINPRANALDNWEYKLEHSAIRWLHQFNALEKFKAYCEMYYFDDYFERYNDINKWTKYWEVNIGDEGRQQYFNAYFEDRTELILKRGIRISQNAKENTVDENAIHKEYISLRKRI